MDVLKPEDLTQCPDDDKELSRDSYLSPTFSIHGDIVAGGQLMRIANARFEILQDWMSALA